VIRARVGDRDRYEVVRGERVECGDDDGFHGLVIVTLDDTEQARRVVAELGYSLSWDSWIPRAPSDRGKGFVECYVVGVDLEATGLVERINARAAEQGVES
jgi:hypothetical protein